MVLARFEMKPTNWIMRMVLPVFVFDTARRNVTVYQGRVPLMRKIGGELKAVNVIEVVAS
jgi:hypothetical protein